jgi:hypothetical protein
LTTVRLDDFGFGTLACVIKWWKSVVMLHPSTSGMFCDGRFTVGEPGQLPLKLLPCAALEMAGNAPA